MTVYAPSEDSLLLQKCMERIIEKKSPGSVLDMGTGSGILARRARELLPESIVIGLDIQKDSIRYAMERSPGVSFVLSDLLSGIRGRFDLIVFNPPYLPACIYDEDPTTTGGVLGCETTNRFISQLKSRLSEKGVCLLLISNQTNPGRVESCLKKEGFRFEVFDSMKLFFEELFVYLISASS